MVATTRTVASTMAVFIRPCSYSCRRVRLWRPLLGFRPPRRGVLSLAAGPRTKKGLRLGLVVAAVLTFLDLVDLDDLERFVSDRPAARLVWRGWPRLAEADAAAAAMAGLARFSSLRT